MTKSIDELLSELEGVYQRQGDALTELASLMTELTESYNQLLRDLTE